MSGSDRFDSDEIAPDASSRSTEPVPEQGADAPIKTLDVRSMNCPMPVLKAKVALGELESGQLLRVLATDPHSVADFQAFCAKTGHLLLQSNEVDGVYEFILRRRA